MKTTIFQGISEGLSFSNQPFFPYGPSQVGDVPRLGDWERAIERWVGGPRQGQQQENHGSCWFIWFLLLLSEI